MKSKSSYHILLADDHALIRNGIRMIIEEMPELEVVGEVGDGIELLEFLGKYEPDMVISDLSMPNMGGLEATKCVKARYPQTKVLIVTSHRGKEYELLATTAGAEGYLPKDFLDEELFTAIRTIRGGGTYSFLI
jgi:DNA-binding NarL/FixJ family response regulator